MTDEIPPERPRTPPIASEMVRDENKVFFLDLMENFRGRYLKVTEDTRGRRNTILIPAAAFKDMVGMVERLVEFESKL